MSRAARGYLFGLAFLMLACSTSTTWADVRLPAIFSKNMVVQSDMPIPVWGWAYPNEEISVTLSDSAARAKADALGNWKAVLPALKAGGPYELVVKGGNELRVGNVLVGEVWLCSGQSNMEMTVRGIRGEAEEAKADYPNLRVFTVSKKSSGMPVPDVEGQWLICTPENCRYFSAVAYFFGETIHKELRVPTGLIVSAWGGTNIEPWTPPEGFDAVPALAATAKLVNETQQNFRKDYAAYLNVVESWVKDSRAKLELGGDLPTLPVIKHPFAAQNKPTSIYNGMVKPLVPYAIRGAIWYQGENNVRDGMIYADKMQALVEGWRKVWGAPNFPFYYVQIAPYTFPGNPKMSLPELWLAQNAFETRLANVGMAVINDVGDMKTIHPTNKRPVGERLALLALSETYGKKNIVSRGPSPEKIEFAEGQARITFKNIGGGLVTRDGVDPRPFELAGADGKYVAATAKIDGQTIVVTAPEIKEPKSVRFAFGIDPLPNLMNKEGLPASTFVSGTAAEK